MWGAGSDGHFLHPEGSTGDFSNAGVWVVSSLTPLVGPIYAGEARGWGFIHEFKAVGVVVSVCVCLSLCFVCFFW